MAIGPPEIAGWIALAAPIRGPDASSIRNTEVTNRRHRCRHGGPRDSTYGAILLDTQGL